MTVGIRRHWRNSTSLVEATEVHPSKDRLLHQVDQSRPYGEGGSRGGD